MNFDRNAPVPVTDYRKFQKIIPGIDGLYDSLLAILEYELNQNDSVLIVGAGGGREIEMLSKSSLKLEILGVDPSAEMLTLARSYIPQNAKSRVKLQQGYLNDVRPTLQFAAATSILVMHFIPDNSEKEDYLQTVRSKLKSGAPYIHVDVSIESELEAKNCGDVIAIHGNRTGAPEDLLQGPANFAQKMRAPEKNCIVPPARNRELLEDAGFEIVSPFFRNLWFTGWWTRAK